MSEFGTPASQYLETSHGLVARTTTVTYTADDIKNGAITQGSHFPPTKNNTRYTTVLFPCHNTLSIIGEDVTI